MYGIAIGFYIEAKYSLRAFLIKPGIILHCLRQLIVTLYRRVVFQYIHNEALFDGLLHGIDIVWL